MSYFKKSFSYVRKHKIITGVALAVFLIVIYYFFGGSEEKSPYEFYAVDRGEVVQEVSTTGKVKAASEADLSFDKSGIVAGVFVSEGTYVYSGQELAKISDTELKTQLLEAEANLRAQEIKSGQLKGGTRTEEIKIAENDLNNAYLPVADILNDAKNGVEDALYKQIDQIFDNDNTAPQLTFTISDTQLKTDSEAGRLTAEGSLLEIKEEISALKIGDHSSLDKSLNAVKTQLLKVADFLSTVLKTVNVEANLSDTTVATYKTNIGTARTNTQAAIEAITTQQKTISSAQKDLDLKVAGSTAEDISYQEAQVEKAQAQVDNIKSQIMRTMIISPINAVVTKRNIEAGEFVGAGTVAFSVISSNRFEVESNVPEVDIAKIKAGNVAKVTLDAYGPDEVFGARVVKINPGETVIEGVSTYKITLSFDEYNEKIKPGMTANIDIETDKKEGVIRLPQRAITRDEGKSMIRIYPEEDGKTPEEKEIKTGLRGSDGMVEIISGVTEGEKVITFEKK
ncbi:MAG: efflux RND transporter periplasmic adaptor subunit [Candidatus Paceibacterota bacterium]